MSAQTPEPPETWMQAQKRQHAEANGTARKPRMTFEATTAPATAPVGDERYKTKVLGIFAERLRDMTAGSRDQTLTTELFNMGKLMRDGVVTHQDIRDAGLDIALEHADESFTVKQIEEKFDRAPVKGAELGDPIAYGEAPIDVADLIAKVVEPVEVSEPESEPVTPAEPVEPTIEQIAEQARQRAAAQTKPAPVRAAAGGETRRAVLTRASDIAPARTKWMWKDRLPMAAFCLLAGREGIGKSTLAYQIAADVTRGRLPGEWLGQPRAVIVCASEDSWAHTIVPRLMAAGADLTLILRIDVTTHDDIEMSLTLPVDVALLGAAITEHHAALVLLDPLMSRLAANLDTHKDADTRRALEPLTKMAEVTKAVMLGLIHVNKSTGNDPLTLIMGSRAFAAVARAVLFVMKDPDDESIRLLGQEKNNLGRTDLPVLTFTIESAHAADTDDGPVFTGRINWQGETDKTIQEAIGASNDDGDARSATAEAADWLTDYLTQPSVGGEASSADIKKAGGQAGHSIDALKRARRKLRLDIESVGFPRRSVWRLPVDPVL